MGINRPAYSNLMKEIKSGKFIFTGELEPTKMVDVSDVVHSAQAMKDYVVAANCTDGPQGMAYISSLVASYIAQKESGLECVYQMTVRDRNRIALFGDILGAAALGLKNCLALTGDHSALGDNPGAKAVFDLDSTQFVYQLSKMIDENVDIYGNEITSGKVEMNVACAANPNAIPREAEILKVGRKVEVGVDFVQTQTAFDIEDAKDFIDQLSRYNVPVLLGLFPLKNYGIASYFNKYIPGVSVPQQLMTDLKDAQKNIKDKKARNARVDEINIDFYVPFIREIKKTTKCAGIHCMAVHYERLFEPLLKDFR